ncbi:MAG: hypothetical protein ACK53L_24830, partial [Pirellulaceae bacterium]
LPMSRGSGRAVKPPTGRFLPRDRMPVARKGWGHRRNLPRPMPRRFHRLTRTEERARLGEWHLPNVPSQRQLGERRVEIPPRPGGPLRWHAWRLKKPRGCWTAGKVSVPPKSVGGDLESTG